MVCALLAVSTAPLIIPDTVLDNLSRSMAPGAICTPLMVPTVIFAAFRFTTSIWAASSRPAVILFAVKPTIFASVMLPSAICVVPMTPVPIIAVVMHPFLMLARSMSALPIRAVSISATSAFKFSMSAVTAERSPISATSAFSFLISASVTVSLFVIVTFSASKSPTRATAAEASPSAISAVSFASFAVLLAELAVVLAVLRPVANVGVV